MADLDVDRARELGVAVPVESPEDYLEASDGLAPGFVRTVDATDPSVGWTVQQRDFDPENVALGDGEKAPERVGYVEPGDELRGQYYLPEQLPDPAIALQSGLVPQKIPADLIITDPSHPQGPEASERVIEEHREKVRAKVAAYRADGIEALVEDDANAAEQKPSGPAAAREQAETGDPGSAPGAKAPAEQNGPAKNATSGAQ